MKFSCEKHILQAAVAVCARAAAAKSPIPTLEGVLLEAGERLRVTGYDLKKGIYTTVEADVSEPGSIVLDAKLFGEMVRRMPDGLVTISSDEDNKTTVKCGKTEFSFMGMDSGEYPELPSVDGIRSYKIKQGVLKSMINQTMFAISDNDSRPVYTGSLFEVEAGTLAMVSVDGYRLAIRREHIEGPEEHNEFIVPGTALSDIGYEYLRRCKPRLVHRRKHRRNKPQARGRLSQLPQGNARHLQDPYKGRQRRAFEGR